MKKTILIAVILCALVVAGFFSYLQWFTGSSPIGKQQIWLNSKAEELADKLPGVLDDFAKKGVTFGEGELTELQGKLTNTIDKSITEGKGGVGKKPDVPVEIDKLGTMGNAQGCVYRGAGNQNSALKSFQSAMENAGWVTSNKPEEASFVAMKKDERKALVFAFVADPDNTFVVIVTGDSSPKVMAIPVLPAISANTVPAPSPVITLSTMPALNPGRIVIKKVAPLEASDAFLFTMNYGAQVGYPKGLSMHGSEQFDSGFTLIPGTYTVSELVLAGWNLPGITITDPSGDSSFSDNIGTINLSAGETVAVTYTNTMTQVKPTPTPVQPPPIPIKVTVTVASPKAGEVWRLGTAQNISWTTTGEGITYVDIYYSTDSGKSMISVALKEPNDGIYTWKVPNTSSKIALVRVLAFNVKGETLALGDSGLFTINIQ